VQITTQVVYKGIIVFVYDESCSVEQHAWTKDAIERIERIKGRVIKSAPSTARPTAKISSKKKTKINWIVKNSKAKSNWTAHEAHPPGVYPELVEGGTPACVLVECPQIRHSDFVSAYRILLSYLGREGVGQP